MKERTAKIYHGAIHYRKGDDGRNQQDFCEVWRKLPWLSEDYRKRKKKETFDRESSEVSEETMKCISKDC